MYGKQAFREIVQRLSSNNLWLLWHMAIAFWHTFGISNGLSIDPTTDLTRVSYPEGPDGHYVTAQAMQKKLEEYLKWLDSYQISWDTNRFNNAQTTENLQQSILNDPSPAFQRVVDMLARLQIMPAPLEVTHVLLVSGAEGHLDASLATSKEDALAQARARVAFWLRENEGDSTGIAEMTIDAVSDLYAQGNETSWTQIVPVSKPL